MSRSRRVSRAVTALLVVFWGGVSLSGCGSSATRTDRSASSSAPRTSVEPADGYNVSRILEIQNDFPPGYAVDSFPPTHLDQEQAKSVGDAVAYGSPVTVVPPQCGPVVKPFSAPARTESVGLRGAGPQGEQLSVGAERSPVPVSVTAVPPGCDQVSYVVDDLHQRGTAERIPAPNIDGTATTALRIQVDGTPTVDYYYAALLSDYVFVDIQARVPPTYEAQPVLSDLLSKAVSTVRGK